jgi:hypothetical protein
MFISSKYSDIYNLSLLHQAEIFTVRYLVRDTPPLKISTKSGDRKPKKTRARGGGVKHMKK